MFIANLRNTNLPVGGEQHIAAVDVVFKIWMAAAAKVQADRLFERPACSGHVLDHPRPHLLDAGRFVGRALSHLFLVVFSSYKKEVE